MEKKLAVVALGGNAILRGIKRVRLQNKTKIFRRPWKIWFI